MEERYRRRDIGEQGSELVEVRVFRRKRQIEAKEVSNGGSNHANNGGSLFLTAVLSLAIYDLRRSDSIIRNFMDVGLRRLLAKVVGEEELARRIDATCESDISLSE